MSWYAWPVLSLTQVQTGIRFGTLDRYELVRIDRMVKAEERAQADRKAAEERERAQDKARRQRAGWSNNSTASGVPFTFVVFA